MLAHPRKIFIFISFVLSNSVPVPEYRPWKEHVRRFFQLEVELHPPPPLPWHTAGFNYSDQDDLVLLAGNFASSHGGGGLKDAVERDLFERTGWQSFYNNFGISEIRNRKLLLLPVLESGFGRRLLYIASGVQIAEALGRHLVVVWATGEHCRASYFDLFSSAPPGVTIVSALSAQGLFHLRPSFHATGASLDPAQEPVVFSSSLSLGVAGYTAEAEPQEHPQVPIVRVAGPALGPRALAAAQALSSPLAALDHESGVQFGLAGMPVSEWRARCHDVLSALQPSEAVRPIAQRLIDRVDTAFATAAAAAAAAASAGGGGASPPPPSPPRGPSSAGTAAGAFGDPWHAFRKHVVGIHARRDQPGVDAPNLLLPASTRATGQREEDDVEWTLAGWSEVPLSRYAEVALTAALNRRKRVEDPTVVVLLSNDAAFANRLSAEIRARLGARAPLESASVEVVVLCARDEDLEDGLSASVRGTTGDFTGNSASLEQAHPSSSASGVRADDDKEEEFASRDVRGSVEAAAEWFALSRTAGLVVHAQRTEFARTASLAGSMTAVEVVPRVGTLVAGGALDLFSDGLHASGGTAPPTAAASTASNDKEKDKSSRSSSGSSTGGSDSAATKSSEGCCTCGERSLKRRPQLPQRDGTGLPCPLVDVGPAAWVWRQWGLLGALCTKDTGYGAFIQHEEGQEGDGGSGAAAGGCEKGGEGDDCQQCEPWGGEEGPLGVPFGTSRRLHVGRTTGADLSTAAGAAAAEVEAAQHQVKAALEKAGAGQWTVVDVVTGPGVDLVVEGMHNLTSKALTSADRSSSSSSFQFAHPPPLPPSASSPSVSSFPPAPRPSIPSSTFTHVYASHVLEHGGWGEAGAALREWRRVLVRGGALSLAVPDAAALAHLLLRATTASSSSSSSLLRSPRHHGDPHASFSSSSSSLHGNSGEPHASSSSSSSAGDELAATVLTVLFGAQRDPTDFHRSGFTERILRRELAAAGFCGAVRVDSFHRFSDDSTTLEVLGTPISLNLEAVACGDLVFDTN